jgi:hypothetical protein
MQYLVQKTSSDNGGAKKRDRRARVLAESARYNKLAESIMSEDKTFRISLDNVTAIGIIINIDGDDHEQVARDIASKFDCSLNLINADIRVKIID